MWKLNTHYQNLLTKKQEGVLNARGGHRACRKKVNVKKIYENNRKL